MMRTMIAGALLTLGTGVALGQTQAPPPADDAAAQAPAETQDAQTAPAETQDAQAAPADAQVAPDAASDAQNGQNGTAQQADPPADPAQEDMAVKDEQTAALDPRAQKKAKRKAECLAINVGKPRHC